MNRAQIEHTQKVVGATVDGFWGPKSTAQCQKFLRSLMPTPNPWPRSDQASLTRFYGAAGDESQLVMLPEPVDLKLYDKTVDVTRIRCHKKVADSLSRAIVAAYAVAPDVISRYFGCYVNRPMRGGSLPSLHARGAAIDFDATKNGNKAHWPTAAHMPIEVMMAFSKEGWLSAGAFWSRDAMHFQATQ
jgi:hypothetical protein